MTIAPSSISASNPLRNLPSVLAIHDLQLRLRRALKPLGSRADGLVAILRLDPLAVVRGLSAAHAPVFRQSPSLPSVGRMVQCLGPSLARRLLANDPVVVAPDSVLRRLWLHAIATALAAQELATNSGLVDPEEAYLLGLLHDLPDWIGALRNPAHPSKATPSAADWITHWQLPTALVTHLHATRAIYPSEAMQTTTDVAGLVRVAERLASLADYPHPMPHDERGVHVDPAAADKADQLAAARLRQRVEEALQAFDLGPQTTGAQPGEVQPGEAQPAVNRRGTLDEAVLSILGCTRSSQYRGIVTALTATAMRYGAYDRAFYAKWQPQDGSLILRAKADGSARRIVTNQVQAAPGEADALRAALAADRPVRLESALRRPAGLLAALSADELLAVPINRDFARPAFLLLDRSLTLLPIELDRDLTMAISLGQIGSLLNDNLLLRRRRQRAQKFALTDPLTHLFNRRMGIVALEREIARTERTSRPLTVLMCDMDHFKQLNDTLGHLQGDSALRSAAEVLRQTLRKGDTICRYGGEEFLIVLPDTTPDEATVLATRLFTTVHNRGNELGLPMTISIGLTTHRAGDTIETLLQRADHALYASKGYGRNRFSADVEATDDRPVVG